MASFAEIWSGLEHAGHDTPYMLIDCAGIEGGQAHLPKQAFAEIECLFAGDLAIELANVGPYLGKFESFAPEVRAVALDLMARQVGILVVLKAVEPGTEPPFSQLHRHFRKFNVVYDPTGKPLFFRYYDPRVLIDVLAVMSPPQIESFFGAVQTFVLEDREGAMARCERQGGRLVVLN